MATFDDIFAVMSAASAGDLRARVALPEDTRPEGAADRFAVALNVLLDDLSQRVHAERSMLEELDATLQSIGDAVIATDLDGRVVRMNFMAAQLTGWSPDDAYGRRLGEVFRIVDDDTHTAVRSPVERVLAQGTTLGLANHSV